MKPRSTTGPWVLLAVLPAAAAAQFRSAPPPPAYALEGVTVVHADGTRSDSVNVVVRGGLLQILEGSALPADARVLDGDGLFVYPGLIDAEAAAEVVWPEPRDAREEEPSWDPSRSRQGFTPHRRVADHLAHTGPDLEGRRGEGVVAALVHPTGGMAPGQPAVVVHRAADVPWKLVDQASAGLSMSLQTARGVYPSQLFGVIAFLRQAFLDARRYELQRAAYRRDPRGLTRPAWDPDYEALLAAARGDAPVYFSADEAEDIRRLFDLQDRFGFRAVLVGGCEAWSVADELVERNIPVLVSLDFPEPDEWDPEADTIDAELDPGAAREKERLENLWANAGRLDSAGVTFALTSGGGNADLIEGARKVVEYGLSREAAFRALTTTPAVLLGLGSLMRLDGGTGATFVVTDGELLDEDTDVVYAFVEGAFGDFSEPPAEEAAADLTGTWSVEMTTPGGGFDATIEMTQDEDGELSGRIEGGQFPPSNFTGSVSGTSVEIRLQPEGLPEPLILNGTISGAGERITGSSDTPFGELSFTATRRPGDDR